MLASVLNAEQESSGKGSGEVRVSGLEFGFSVHQPAEL